MRVKGLSRRAYASCHLKVAGGKRVSARNRRHKEITGGNRTWILRVFMRDLSELTHNERREVDFSDTPIQAWVDEYAQWHLGGGCRFNRAGIGNLIDGGQRERNKRRLSICH